MSRILKRPMFKKGGEVMEGIMTGIKPRTNYADGKTREEIISGALENLSPSSQGYAQSFMDLAKLGGTSNKDLLTNVLIQGGLRGMSQTGGGGTLGNLAKAFQEPTEQALSESFASKRSEQQAKLKGLEFDIAKQLKEKTGKDGYESGSYYGRQKTLLDFYSKEPGFDANEAFVLVQQLMSLQDKGIGTSFKQVMQDASGNPLTDEQIENKNPPVGSVFYDKELRVMKQIDENGNLVLLDTVKESTGE